MCHKWMWICTTDGLEGAYAIVWIPEVDSLSPDPGFVPSIHVALGELLNL